MIAHGGKVFCAIHFQTVTAGKMNVKYVWMVKTSYYLPITSYKQQEYIEVPSTKHKMDKSHEAKTHTKTVITTKYIQVGEVLDEFQETFAKVKQHQNTKRIQAADFQNDIKDHTKSFTYRLCTSIPV